MESGGYKNVHKQHWKTAYQDTEVVVQCHEYGVVAGGSHMISVWCLYSLQG